MTSLSQSDRQPASAVPQSVLLGWDNCVEFDAYTATTNQIDRDRLVHLVANNGDDVEEKLPGHHRFQFRDVVRDMYGNPVASIYYGGETHQGRVMLDVKGYRTRDAVRVLRSASIDHRCTRMDSRIDFDAPGAFEALLGPLTAIKTRKGLRGERRGDWEHPEDGRTMYVGSPKSAVRVRLYEKGKEPGYRSQCRWDWVRLEVQVRPQQGAKEVYSAASALQAWGSSEWTRELAGELLKQTIAPLKAEAVKPPSVDEHKLYWMCKQYGAPLMALLQRYEGDLEAFGAHINKALAQVLDEDNYGRSRRPTAIARNV
jgi:Replication initiation factor